MVTIAVTEAEYALLTATAVLCSGLCIMINTVMTHFHVNFHMMSLYSEQSFIGRKANDINFMQQQARLFVTWMCESPGVIILHVQKQSVMLFYIANWFEFIIVVKNTLFVSRENSFTFYCTLFTHSG